MKVLLINGSPNELGCTYTALTEMADTLTQEGIEHEMLWIGSGAQQGKWLKEELSFSDAVTVTRERMGEADGLVLGAPVYFASTPGPILTLLDKVFFFPKQEGLFRLKPAAAIVSARRAGTTATLDILHKYLSHAEMPIVSSEYWAMVHGNSPQEVRQDEEGMQIMRVLARNMAWLMKSIDCGKQAGLTPPEKEARLRTNFIRA